MLRSQLNESLVPTMELVESEPMEPSDERLKAERNSSSRSPSKARSLSDAGPPPALSPSPKFREPQKPLSKDDSNLNDSPTTPRRPAFPRGLSLQMPPRDVIPPSPFDFGRAVVTGLIAYNYRKSYEHPKPKERILLGGLRRHE